MNDESRERRKDYTFRFHVEKHLRFVRERNKEIYGKNIDKLPFEIDIEMYQWEMLYNRVRRRIP
jgi:hypothetical protein